MNQARGVSHANKIVLLLTAVLVVFAACAAFSIATAGAASGSGGLTDSGEAGGATDGPPAQASKYDDLWAKVPSRDRRWARSTAECESGKNPNAIGGGGQYRGAFQFRKSTWRNAPKSPGGDPIDYDYKTQAVVAVALKRQDGTGHWPNCG
jgi:Transglycosylase-like domain